MIQVRNCGSSVLTIERVLLSRTLDAESLEDFSLAIEGCDDVWDCDGLNAKLCPSEEPDCIVDGKTPGDSLSVPVRYENRDGSMTDTCAFSVFSDEVFLNAGTFLSVGP
jgi:hypothetical protein